jgi:hypothetical protein
MLSWYFATVLLKGVTRWPIESPKCWVHLRGHTRMRATPHQPPQHLLGPTGRLQCQGCRPGFPLSRSQLILQALAKAATLFLIYRNDRPRCARTSAFPSTVGFFTSSADRSPTSGDSSHGFSECGPSRHITASLAIPSGVLYSEY